MPTEPETYTLRLHDDPVLYRLCEPVAKGERLTEILHAMSHICTKYRGCGLAAPQIGVGKQIIYVKPHVSLPGEFIINPEYVSVGERMETQREGCLSFPCVFASIERYWSVRIAYRDVKWKERVRTFTAMDARIVQHETDHLAGVCLVGEAWKAQQMHARAMAGGAA